MNATHFVVKVLIVKTKRILRIIINYYLAALKKYATFSGRAQRAEYWFFVLFQYIILFLLGIFAGTIGEINSNASSLFAIMSIIFILGSIMPVIAVTVRRLHDSNRSGWAMLIYLIPFIGIIVLLIFLATDGTRGENQYGPDPKEIGRTSEKKTNKKLIWALCFGVLLIVVFGYITGLRRFPEKSDPKQITLRCTYHGKKVTLAETLYKSVNEYYASEPKRDDYVSEAKYESFVFSYQEDKTIKNIGQKINIKGKNMGLNSDETMDLATCFVQNIPYDKKKGQIILSALDGESEPDNDSETVAERFPYETLYDNSGTCTDKSYLEAAIIKELGYGVSLLAFDKERHMAVGVKTPKKYTSFDTDYSYLETTNIGFMVGQLPILDKDTGGAKSPEIEKFSEDREVKFDELLPEIPDSNFSPPSEIFKISDGKQYTRVIEISKILDRIKELTPKINSMKKKLTTLKKQLTEENNDLSAAKNMIKGYEKKVQLKKNSYLINPTEKNYSDYTQAYNKYKTNFYATKKRINNYNSDVNNFNTQIKAANTLIYEYNKLVKQTRL